VGERKWVWPISLENENLGQMLKRKKKNEWTKETGGGGGRVAVIQTEVPQKEKKNRAITEISISPKSRGVGEKKKEHWDSGKQK